MCRKAGIGVLLSAVAVIGGATGIQTAMAAEPGIHPVGGRVVGCEHFAFQRARVAEGFGGPAREACKSWHVSMCTDKQGTAYALDAENCQVYRVTGDTVRVLAGDGIRGYRDGPADRARFDFLISAWDRTRTLRSMPTPKGACSSPREWPGGCG